MSKFEKTIVACIALVFAALSTTFAHAQTSKIERVAPFGVKYFPMPLKHQEIKPLHARSYGAAIKPNVKTLEEFQRLTKGGLFSKGPTVYLDMSNLCKWTDVSGVGNGRVFTFWAHYYLFDKEKHLRVYRAALPTDQFGWLSERAKKVRPLPQCSIEGDKLTITFKRTKQEIKAISELEEVAQK